jgi:hypothetical protein
VSVTAIGCRSKKCQIAVEVPQPFAEISPSPSFVSLQNGGRFLALSSTGGKLTMSKQDFN